MPRPAPRSVLILYSDVRQIYLPKEVLSWTALGGIGLDAPVDRTFISQNF